MPTRYLKPGIRDSDRIETLSATPDAEVLYYRLLVSVDDFGRADARPLMVKSLCFPIRLRATAIMCEQWLKKLAESRLLILYEVDGKPYLQLTKWDNKPRAEKSKYPPPSAQMHTDAYNCPQMLPVTVTVTGTGTGTKHNGASAKALLPEETAITITLNDKSEYPVSKDLVTEWGSLYPAVDVPQTLREIRGYFLANQAKRKTPKGILRCINGWLSREQNKG